MHICTAVLLACGCFLLLPLLLLLLGLLLLLQQPQKGHHLKGPSPYERLCVRL
jgi:hypothetical protein